MDELLTANQVAAILGVTRQRVNAIARTGRMGRKVGRDYVFTPAEVAAYKAQPKQPHGIHPLTGKKKPSASQSAPETDGDKAAA